MKRWRRIIEVLALISFITVGVFLVCRDFPFSQPSSREELTPAKFWKELDRSTVQCQLCFRKCTIREGERGHCMVRKNKGGKLYSTVYGKVTAQVDPVEKEPLLHFLPGTETLCFGTAGCNFQCLFCQNWQLAAMTQEEIGLDYLSPREAVDMAIEYGCSSVSFTYNEPTVFYEWVYDVCQTAKEKEIRTYFHTNGAINPEPLKELLKYLDAVCVDLKGFTSEFFEKTSLSQMEPVLNTLKTIKESGVWFEITCLTIPSLNDDPAITAEMCQWIKENLGSDVPVHFSRFFPAYKLTRLPPTPIETLEQVRNIALKTGLNYVTIGNVPGHKANSTFCPQCGEVVINRIHFSVIENNLEDGKCKFCGYPIPGVWK